SLVPAFVAVVSALGSQATPPDSTLPLPRRYSYSSPMLFDRQRLLLVLVDALGGDVANTDFQKLLFHYTQEWETEPTYEFVPYQFGGFSFTSYADKRRLIEHGLLAADE